MSEKQADEASKSGKVDDELSELLDSALEDFKKEPAKDTEVALSPQEAPEAGEEWSDDFIRQAATQFESNIANLLGANQDGTPLSTDQLQAKFQEMAQAAQQVIDNPTVTDNSNDFASTISQTLQGLSAGTEGLQSPLAEQDLLGMFGGAAEQNAFLPFMQGMMQSLLSKEVLYPSLKDILDRFPEWMEKNKDTLSNEDAERFEKQRQLMQEVCTELEQEKDTDSVDVKKVRFEKVLGVMQKLQDYGQPPTDLVGDVETPFAQGGMDPNQCNLM